LVIKEQRSMVQPAQMERWRFALKRLPE